MRYEWSRADGADLVAFVIATGGSDVAVTCASPTLAAAAKSCAAVGPSVRLAGVEVLSPGPDAAVAHALLGDLTPVSSARSRIAGLAASTLSARSDPARRIGKADQEAATSLGQIVAPARNMPAVTNLANALDREASAFLALARSAGNGKRAAYAAARTLVMSSSIRVSAAAKALRADGFALADLGAITLPGLPAVATKVQPSSVVPTQTVQPTPTHHSPGATHFGKPTVSHL
jgi:hypothetical protein